MKNDKWKEDFLLEIEDKAIATKIFVDDNKSSKTFIMDNPNKGIYIAPSVWCNLSNFSSDAVCVVLASHEYNPDGYINDYKEFKLKSDETY